MSQKLENLSSVMDGEIDENADISTIAKDEALGIKWQRYHLMRDLLRNEQSHDLSFDVSKQIAAAVEQELTIVAPKPSWKENPIVAAVVPLIKQSTQVAAAACVTAMVIFGYQTYNQPDEDRQFIQAPSPLRPLGGLEEVNFQADNTGNDQLQMLQLLEQRRQLNALIENHAKNTLNKQAAMKRTLDADSEQDSDNPQQ